MIKFAIFFAVSFIINFIWEVAHASLYQWLPPMEKSIGHFIWFSAKDAAFYFIFILAVAVAARSRFWFLKPKLWQIMFLAVTGLIVSFYVEYNAINVGRWAYLSSMPIIPILNVGLSPILQMSLGPILAIFASRFIYSRFITTRLDTI